MLPLICESGVEWSVAKGIECQILAGISQRRRTPPQIKSDFAASYRAQSELFVVDADCPRLGGEKSPWTACARWLVDAVQADVD